MEVKPFPHVRWFQTVEEMRQDLRGFYIELDHGDGVCRRTYRPPLPCNCRDCIRRFEAELRRRQWP